MTSTGCEEYVKHEVNKLTGIINTTVSYEKGNAIVEFDKTKTDIQEIEKAISKTAYSVTDKKKKYNEHNTAINNHLPRLRTQKRRNNADRRLSIFLRV
jgi:copper chaperone CopZ